MGGIVGRKWSLRKPWYHAMEIQVLSERFSADEMSTSPVRACKGLGFVHNDVVQGTSQLA